MSLGRAVQFLYAVQSSDENAPTGTLPSSFVQIATRLGGIYGALSEYAASRPDVVPMGFFAHTKPTSYARPFEQITIQVERAFERPVTNLFLSIARLPSWSDRTSQTHRATLLNGQQVMVTVLNERLLQRDARAIRWLQRLSRYSKYRRTLALFLEEFKKHYFRSGVCRARELEALTSDKLGIRIPVVYWSHTTSYIVTTEYIPAVPLNLYMQDVLREGKDRLVQSREIRLQAQQNLNLYVQTALSNGYLAQNMNAESLSIAADGRLNLMRSNTLYLKPLERGNIIRVMRAVVEKDPRHVAQMFIVLGSIKGSVGLEQFEKAVGEILEASSAEYVMTKHVQLLRCALKHGITYSEPVIQFLRSLQTIEQVLKMLLPDGSKHEGYERISRNGRLQATREKNESQPVSYSIKRFAAPVHMQLTTEPASATEPLAVYQINPPSGTAQVQALGIISGTLFLSSALVVTLVPFTISSILFATCFLGLGCKTAWSVLRNTRITA